MDVWPVFLDYAQQHNIHVFAGNLGDITAATLRSARGYGVFINFAKMAGRVQLNGVLGHEQGHCATGALGNVHSPFQLVEKNEETANRWYYSRYITKEAIQSALNAGCTEFWQLEEALDFPERDIRAAIDYYTNACGVTFRFPVDH